MHVFFRSLLLAMSLLLLPVAAAAQGASTAASPAVQNDSKLGPGDIVEVEVLGQTDFGRPRVRVRSDGTIPLPLIDSIQASGLDSTQLASAIQQKLVAGDFYKNPAVNVNLVSYASHYVVVLGAVAQPGLVPIDRPYRVSEILARVGGTRESAADYLVLSSTGGAQRNISISSVAQGVGGNDPFVQADDKLFVPNAEMFYIYGQVNAPGSYPLKAKMTLRQALARGGGLTPSGSEKKLTLYRQQQKLKANLDAPLMPGDVVVVGERMF